MESDTLYQLRGRRRNPFGLVTKDMSSAFLIMDHFIMVRVKATGVNIVWNRKSVTMDKLMKRATYGYQIAKQAQT